MRKRTRTAVAAVAAVAALALAAVATAAYTSPKLSVSYAGGNVTRLVASAAVGDDATARAAIVIPTGTAITTTAAPGTRVGTARAQVSALQLGGALLPLAGDIVVAPPGAVTPTAQAQCTLGATPQATLLLVLQAAGQTINLPAYVIPTSGAQTALGAAQLVICLPPPDLPPPVGATFGAKFLSADLTLTGVFGPVVQGAWVAFWTPWNPGVGTPNTAATVASPAAIAPGGITLGPEGQRRQAPRRAGRPGWRRRRDASDDPRRDEAHRHGLGPGERRVHVFRAEALEGDGVPRPHGRRRPERPGGLRPVRRGRVPCVNPTVSGFTATSGIVRIR